MSDGLREFVRESNRIEGILREPTADEVAAHETILALNKLTMLSIEMFVSIVQPGAKLRRAAGMNVRVGNYVAPKGGPNIEKGLQTILVNCNYSYRSAYLAHRAYETLHPFTDGNGRSGRAIWLWMMGGIENAPLGFLHHWYYQSLQESRS